MLEHLPSGDCDEALGGDLLEEFQAGRSDSWYRRQVLAACLVSWTGSLRARISLLGFALVWCLPVPAWMVLCERIEHAGAVGRFWQMTEARFWPGAVAMGLTLHSTFLWAGILLFCLGHRFAGSPLRWEKIRRALLLAPLIFTPVFLVVFVLLALYWDAVFPNALLAASPLRQMADLHLLANALRVPYFVAFLGALWAAAPRPLRASQPLDAESVLTEFEPEFDTLAVLSNLAPFALRRFLVFLAAAGLVNAMIGGYLLCRLPEPHSATLASLFLRAVVHVGVGVLAGALGSWLYWKHPSSPLRDGSPGSFAPFALICAAGWVWVPPMVVFADQLSAGAALIAMIGAFVLVSGLRSATGFVFSPAQPLPSGVGYESDGLFQESLQRPRADAFGYLIAVSLYAAGAALVAHSIFPAIALLAFSAALFAWKATVPSGRSFESLEETRRAALRLGLQVIPAILVTIWALAGGAGHRDLAAHADEANAVDENSSSQKNSPKPGTGLARNGLGGYESLILWPFPEKKQLLPPILQQNSLLAPGTREPVVLRFNGEYWFVQAPQKRPGPEAHQASGTPISVDIRANNAVPLVMDAHQNLSAPVPLARCREIEVEIENRDNKAGSISLALLLTDAAAPHKQTLYLGQQPIVSTDSTHFSIKQSPVFETLRFPVPPTGSIRKFSEITVLVLPDVEHMFAAPKIAIQQFKLFPR
jgi:hypothetical protein